MKTVANKVEEFVVDASDLSGATRVHNFESQMLALTNTLLADVLESGTLYVHTVRSNMNGHVSKVVTQSSDFPSAELGLKKGAVDAGMLSWNAQLVTVR